MGMTVWQQTQKQAQSLPVLLCRPLITVLLQFLVGLLDRGALPGQNAEALLHLPQLVQVAVPGPALQRQLLLLREQTQTERKRQLEKNR